MPETNGIDYFISYTAADEDWAQWVDAVLREAGYTTRIQCNDALLGRSFIAWIHEALMSSRYVLCLFSARYFESRYGAHEWHAAYGARNLIPIRIEAVTPPGLLAPIVYLDLADLGRSDAARHKLLTELSRLPQGDSRPPSRSVDTPGSARPSSSGPPASIVVPKSSPIPRIWNLRRTRNALFTGREEVLELLHRRLNAGAGAARIQTLSGLGGVGKTQLALEYAYRYRDYFCGVWWLRAGDHKTLSADYAALAAELRIPEARADWSQRVDQDRVIAAVQRVLSDQQRFLLIFDNAERDIDLEPYFPLGDLRNVIVTTRTPNLPRAAQSMHLDVWDEASAVDFLLKGRVLDASAKSDSADALAARHIAERLGYLPLALSQASAYMTERVKALAEFELLLARYGVIPIEQAVATTWSLAFQELDAVPGARALLNLCAFLAPEAIRLSELRSASVTLRTRWGEAHELPREVVVLFDDELLLDEAKECLRRFSLVVVERDTLAVHRLVQELTRKNLGADQRILFERAALRVVAAIFPDDSDHVASWRGCARLVPHVRAVLRDGADLTADAHAAVTLLNNTGLYFKALALYEDAKELYERAISTAEQGLGAQHELLATSACNLGALLRATGSLARAEQEYLRALAIDTNVFGPEHPRVAEILNNLALVLKNTERSVQAEAFLRRALEICERASLPNERTIGKCLTNLARLLHDSGRFADAEPMYRRALAIHDDARPSDPLLVAIALNNLAKMLWDEMVLTQRVALGRDAEVDRLFQRALALCVESLPNEHPSATRIRANAERFRISRRGSGQEST